MKTSKFRKRCKEWGKGIKLDQVSFKEIDGKSEFDFSRRTLFPKKMHNGIRTTVSLFLLIFSFILKVLKTNL